eukprot:8469771-Pyramimonas_sp.AAC.1
MRSSPRGTDWLRPTKGPITTDCTSRMASGWTCTSPRPTRLSQDSRESGPPLASPNSTTGEGADP